MKNIFESLRRNRLVVVLLAVIVVLLVRQVPTGMVVQRSGVSDFGFSGGEMAKISSIGIMPPIFQESAPVESTNRLVVTNTNLSLKVNDVRKAIDQVMAEAEKLGGFLVESSLTIPEGAASGQVSVRIPSGKLKEGLTAIRAFGVKVISENVVGTDVTSEYVDLAARLDTLLKTKAKFDQILAAATEIADILNVQRELINLQTQIDSVRGQQKYLEQTAKLSLVTVYLATDELALPYAPDKAWRPMVIFREAVRSLVGSVRGIGTTLIWVAVYAPVWLPILLIAWWLKRRLG